MTTSPMPTQFSAKSWESTPLRATSLKAPLENQEYVSPPADGDRWLMRPSVATHTTTGQRIAMKYSFKAVIHIPKIKTRVQYEVEYMRTLRYPRIIKLYVYVRSPLSECPCVMRHSDIRSNGHHNCPAIRALRTRTWRFFQQLISSIEYNHKLKIVKKPESHPG